MKPRLARMLSVVLLLGGMLPSPGARQDAQPRAQYKPAAVVPALGLRG